MTNIFRNKAAKSRIRHRISKKKTRHLTIEQWEGNREIKRSVSLSDVPVIIRKGGGSQLSGILKRPNMHVRNASQQFFGAKETENSVQILTNGIDGCKLKITTVSRRRSEDIRKCEDFADEYDRGERESQRYEFCRQVWEGIHNHMAEQIQVIWPNVHHDVLAKLNFSCELVRSELGTQLNWLRGVQVQIDGGVNHWGNAVDTKLVESSERCDREENVVSELYTAMQK